MNFHRLNHNNVVAVKRFEEAFYIAFSRAKANRLVRHIWIWDDGAKRLRTRIAYEDQHVFVLQDSDGSIDTATALNWRLAHYQASQLGFSVPSDMEGHAEILTLFSRRDADLTGLRVFLRKAAEASLALGIRSADATCTDRLLPVYQHLGGVPLANTMVEGERRTLLRFELEPLTQLQQLT